jgi:type I restriction enzyme S subunit
MPDATTVAHGPAPPTDWHEIQLGDVVRFLRTASASREMLSESGPIGYIHYGDIHASDSPFMDCSPGRIPAIHRAAVAAFPLAETGDVAIADASEDLDGVAKSVELRSVSGPVVGGLHTILMRAEKGALADGFKAYMPLIPGFRESLRRLAKNSSVYGISKDDVASVRLTVPEIDEQRRIAGALTDAEDRITRLASLRGKKRDIRDGLVHALITGRTRLPGFTQPWTTQPLGELLKVRHGKSQHLVADENGPYPILATGGELGRASRPLYDKPSVLIGRKGTIDEPQYVDQPFWTIDTLFYTEIAPAAAPRFIYYLFTLIPWLSYNEAAGLPTLNSSTIERIPVSVPQLREQQEVASVLDGAMAELGLLERELVKMKSVRDGMAQALLSGRTRLV